MNTIPTYTGPLESIARRFFLAWEKRLIAYIAVLTVRTVVLAGPTGFINRRLGRVISDGAVVVNLLHLKGRLSPFLKLTWRISLCEY